MDVVNKYNFFFFQLFDTDIGLIFDENFARVVPLPPVPVPHYHEVWELYYVSEGKLDIKVLEKNFSIKKHQMFVIPPYTEHCIVSGSEDLRHTSIRFFTSTESDHPEKPINSMLKGVVLAVFPSSSDSNNLLDQLKQTYIKYLSDTVKNPWLTSKITAIAMNFFIHVLESITQANHIQPPAYKQKENFDLMLMEYLMLCGPEEITLGQLAKKINYSETQTSRLIKKKFGKSFRTMIAEIKLEKARLHLTKTDESIEHISDLLGFKNQKSFFSSFKNAEGISPTEYRKLHKPK